MDMEEANNPESLLAFVCTHAFLLRQLQVECAYGFFCLGSITCMEPYNVCLDVINMLVLIWCKKLVIVLIGMDAYLRSNLVGVNTMRSHQELLAFFVWLHSLMRTRDGFSFMWALT